MRTRLLMLLIIAAAIPLQAATIRVPQDQPTIQAGIDAAVNGDTVLVGPGTYGANIVLVKSITIVSTAGPDSTSIFPITSNIQTIQADNCNPSIVGFTFTGSSAISAIRFTMCNTRVVNCIVRNNTCTIAPVEFYGGASGFIGSCVVDRCRVFENSGGQYSGGILLTDIDDHSIIQNSIFYSNTGQHGGGITLWNTENSCVVRCTIYDNTVTEYGGAIALVSGCENDTVLNNTVVANTSTSNKGGGFFMQNSSCFAINNIVANSLGTGIFKGTIRYNDLYENEPSNAADVEIGPGNILENPEFLDPEVKYFQLAVSSVCVNTGDPSGLYTDQDGSVSDMGAISVDLQQNPVLHVPTDFSSIQEAVDALTIANTISVGPGVYSEDLQTHGKLFNLVGAGAENTTLVGVDSTLPLLEFDQRDASLAYADIESLAIKNIRFAGCKNDTVLFLGSTQDLYLVGMLVSDCIFQSNGLSSQSTTILADVIGTLRVHKCSFLSNNGSLINTGTTEHFRSNVVIDSNLFFENSGNNLVALRRSHSTLILANSFLSNSGSLLNYECNSCSVTGNEFKQNLCDSLLVGRTDQEYGFVQGNIFDSNVVTGTLITISQPIPDFIGASDWILLNTITNNTAGSLFSIASDEVIYFERNLLNGNRLTSDSCVVCGLNSFEGQYVIDSNIITSNVAAIGMSLLTQPIGFFQVHSNDSWNNELGNFGGDVDSTLNISANPLFCDAPNGNFALAAQSPAVGMGPFGVGCSAVPNLDFLSLDNQQIQHLTNPQPKAIWHAADVLNLAQTSFEIAVSTDNDWQFAEMWNPAPFASADTFVVYNGAPLLDGQTYWLRLRVSNSLGWSNWSELTFRMNSVPTAPQLRLPANSSIVASQYPNLTIRNPIDAENDSMFLTFELSADSFATSFFPFQTVPSNDSLTTVAVPVMLNENLRFWWRVKASDYYEESAYSPVWSFWINSSNTAPSPFGLLSPPNTLTPTLEDNTPDFSWQPSFDFDPGDSVEFTLQLSIDVSFSFASQIPGLIDPSYTPANPLEWGRRYWWRVKAEDNSSGITWSNAVFSFTIMRLGDGDGNGIVTISDPVYLINYIFAGGPAPNPLLSGDADCNGLVTISDAVYLINYIFAAGPPPCEP